MDAITAEAAPPYFAFKTLTNLLTRLEEHGVPPRIDRSVLSNISFSAQAQVMAGIRSLGLTEGDGTVTPLMSELVAKPDERPRILGDILRDRFPEAVRLGEENGTQEQLENVFKGFGLNGETARKATAFYLQAATYTGLPVSPHFKKPRTSGGGGGARRSTRARSRKAAQQTPETPATAAPLVADPKDRYIDLLLKRAEAEDSLNDELFDRIERVIGVNGGGRGKRKPTKSAKSPKPAAAAPADGPEDKD